MISLLDPLYGRFFLSPRVAKIVSSPLLTRLKGIHQNGTNFLVDPRQRTTRYEHSLGALALTVKLGGGETEQVAALLHDVSHTVFSHVIDLVYENKKQNTHELLRAQFLESKRNEIQTLAITKEELDHENLALVKSVDRIDYCLRDLRATCQITQEEVARIVNNLVLEGGILKCQDLDTARLLFNKFIQVNQKVYFDPKAEVAAKVMSTILQNILQEEDLFLEDAQILKKIERSRFREVLHAINPTIAFQTQDKGFPVLRKLRYIDPAIAGYRGNLTALCEETKNALEKYLKNPTTVRYHIPILEA